MEGEREIPKNITLLRHKTNTLEKTFPKRRLILGNIIVGSFYWPTNISNLLQKVFEVLDLCFI